MAIEKSQGPVVRSQVGWLKRTRAGRRVGRTGSVLVQSTKEFVAADPMSQAAAIAYYTIFSLPAVLIITVMAAATLYDETAVRNAMLDQAGQMIGQGTAEQLRSMLENARVTETRFLAKVIGLITLVVSAGTVFASLQSSLNRIWQVESRPGRAIWKYVSTRLISVALVASFGFLLLVSLVLDTVLVAFIDRLGQWLSGTGAAMLAVVNVVLSYFTITLVFAMVYKVLPDVSLRWRNVWGGAFLTALLFTLGKYLIGLYIGLSDVGDTYGAAGAVVIILVWVYYSTVILLFGAHYTHVYTRDHGGGVVPSSHATAPKVQSSLKDMT